MSLHEKRAQEIREQVRISAWKKQERFIKSKEEFRIYNDTYGDSSDKKTEQSVKPVGKAIPTWALILKVDFPCTLQQAKQARDILFLKVHPDHGGSNESFIQAKKAWDEAVIYFREHP